MYVDQNFDETGIVYSRNLLNDAIKKDKDFVVSAWVGVVYYVKKDGTKTQLLDTRAQKLNTADIGFDKTRQIIYVPTFFGNSVTAYQLK